MASRVSDLLDLLGVLVISEKAEGLAFTINLVMTDTDEIHFIELADANLSHIQLDKEIDADTTVRITKAGLLAVFSQTTTLEELAAAGNATIEGNADSLSVLAGLLDTFDQGFPIVPMPSR
jgi:alkyl sulfatase BDS1-like metallo-beta-lactamase superfamily hydrolase